MTVYRSLLFLGLAALSGACSSTPEYAPDSPHYAYPADMRLNLTRPLTIPAEQATLRLQYGHPVARNGVEESQPYCIFELDTVAATPQQVRPDTFRVTRFQRRVETASAMPTRPWRVAGPAVGFDDRPSHLYYISEFRLHSDAQPQVRALACQSNQAAAGIAIPRHLTLAEIRRALGEYFVVELPR